MKVVPAVVAWLGLVVVGGCGGAPGGQAMGPMVTMAPDDFVLRDVRKNAAQYLRCQVPNIQVAMGPWAGSEGNITAYGCGYEVNYYLRCITNHQCSMRATD